jgi:hypothetical protein
VTTKKPIHTSFLKNVRAGAGLFAISFLLGVAAVPETAPKANGATETFRSKERFQLSATLHDKAGRTKTVRVSARQWDVLGNQRVAQFPEHAFLLVELLGGRVTTVIAGKEQKRHHGEFWTVPAGAPMSVTAVGEDATLRVISFTAP